MKKYLFLLFIPLGLTAQTGGFEAFKKYPFPAELCASAKGAKIAWTLDEQGKRNIYVAEGPAFHARKLTRYDKDDGQEISSLSISDDGQRVVFVRGGEHGGNWETGLPTNPSSETTPFKVQVASVPFDGGDVKYLSEGDYPIIAPNGKKVAFIKGGQVWEASVDSANGAKSLFATKGNVGSLEWSPDGGSLLFVSHRGDHSIIGVYTNADAPIQWIAPSYNFDDSPHWSPDGKKIVFVRTPGAGGAPDSMLVNRHEPWSIYTADLSAKTPTLLWKAPVTLRGSEPSTHGGANLHWATGDRIVFLTYQDGWPHLYSAAATGGTPTLLTPGNFMCEHIKLSADRKYLTFSANTGADPLDLERRHAAKVSVDRADMQILTQGAGLAWTPVLTGDGNALAFISATPQQPPTVAIMQFNRSNKNAVQLVGADLLPTDFPKSTLITPKQVIFTSADGVSVHADLFLPESGAARKPAIVYLHGGPPRQMLLGWNYSDYYSNAYASNQYLASLGFVVLAVNYRLGIGYGYEFHHPAAGGPAGASEYQDVKAAGEWLQRQNFVDPAKIGVYGGSYGGYLTAMALARDSKIFAAGVDIHGVHDWGKAESIMTTFADKTEKAPDYDKAVQTAWSSSPIASMSTWRSPVLLIHADDDRNVRFNQTTDLIYRLEKQGVPYETLMIPDDTHHWLKWSHAVQVYGAVAEFFVRKLKNESK